MVILVNRRRIAIYCILEIVCCSRSLVAANTVYAKENQPAILTFKLPRPFNKDVQVTHTREDGKAEKVAFFRKDSSFSPFADWKPKLQALFNREGNVGFTIKSAKSEDAGEYNCIGEGMLTIVSDCRCLLVIIVKPNIPRITQTETSLKCEHSSRTKPSNHGLDHTIQWLDGGGTELDVSKSDKFSINDKGELQINQAYVSDQGLTFKCKTADLVDSTTGLSLQFSEPSKAYVFKGLPKTTVTKQTISTDSTASTSTIRPDNNSLPTDPPNEIKNGYSPVVMIVTIAALFMLVFVIFLTCQQLIKKKPELQPVQEIGESAMTSPLPSQYQLGRRKESEIN